MLLGDLIENMCLSCCVEITLIDDALDDMGNEIILANVNSMLDIDDRFCMDYEVTFTTIENNNIIFYVKNILTA